MIIDEKYHAIIEQTCLHLKNTVNSIQIINWLTNFKEHEWNTALSILRNVKYYTVADIINEFEKNLKSALDSTNVSSRVFIHAIGEYGKSGSSMMYFLKKTNSFTSYYNKIKNTQNNKIIIDNVSELELITENSTLILIDDIIGSGGSTSDYLRDFVLPNLNVDTSTLKFKIVCISYMSKSLLRLKKKYNNIEIFGDCIKEAFAVTGSLFGSRKDMIAARKLCYHYGKDIYRGNALGYQNSQALVVFAHASPNNTVPIIWSDNKNKNDGKQWLPIYPRSAYVRVSQAKALRENSKLWAFQAYKLNLLPTPQQPNSPFNQVDYKIISIIYLIKRKVLIPTICQRLGITVNEYEDVIHSGNKKGIFSSSGELTKQGEQIYLAMKTNVNASKSRIDRKTISLPTYKTFVPEPSWAKG